MLEPSTAITIGMSVLGGVVWGLRLEGKVGEHTQLFIERKDQADYRHEDLTARLDRIEDKLDSLRKAI